MTRAIARQIRNWKKNRPKVISSGGSSIDRYLAMMSMTGIISIAEDIRKIARSGF
ncbi:hypothetical protein [Roseibium salinum]|uniref:Uncharacterized protein n=1 Tax=Roseibium salinum TaxID=1604349 RepID=A0ABT3R3T7_9HYPH|nr:hypothetical protein [Roseibium sp. DSM 29163]MCX2723859.1 hypothetical protein [Roseibium sp. DSM 29163]